jgi:hypothetical protein
MAKLWQAAFLGCLILSVHYIFRSLRYVAPGFTRITWRNIFRPIPLWRREAFVGIGWQYRKRALLFLAIAGALLILGLVYDSM